MAYRELGIYGKFVLPWTIEYFLPPSILRLVAQGKELFFEIHAQDLV